MSSFSQVFAGVSTFREVKQKVPVLTKRKKTLKFGLKNGVKEEKKVAIMEEPTSDILHYLIICMFSGGR